MWEDDVRSGGGDDDQPTPEPKSGDAGKGGKQGNDGKPAKEDKDSIRLSRADYDTMREELAELKFWKNSRREEEPEPEPKSKREEPEDDDDIEAMLKEDPEKFTDEFSA